MDSSGYKFWWSLACDFFPCNFCRGFCIRSSLLSPGLPENLLLREGRWNKKKLEETDMNSNSQCISKLPIKRRTCEFIILYVDDSLRLCRQAVPELNRFRRWSANRKAVGKQEALESIQWNVLLEFSLTYYEQIGWIENGIIHLVISCVWFLQILANVGTEIETILILIMICPVLCLLISGIPCSRSHQDNATFLSTNGNTHRAWSCVTPLEGQWNLQGLLYLLNPWECHGPRLKGW